MRRPVPLSLAPYYPITSGLAVLAVVATAAWWSGRDMSIFVDTPATDPLAWQTQPWRLVTSTLLHVDVLHLLFNLYWLWAFGSLVEQVWGSGRLLGIVLFFAAGSSAAELALFSGGVGLSGVNYGLFGLLWMLAVRRDARFVEAVDRNTVRIFIGWFFFCIASTYLGLQSVANAAHGAGAALGVLLGLAIAGRRQQRPLFGALLVLFVLLIAAAATVARPYVNLEGPLR